MRGQRPLSGPVARASVRLKLDDDQGEDMELQVTSSKEQNLTRSAEVWAVRLGLLCHPLG